MVGRGSSITPTPLVDHFRSRANSHGYENCSSGSSSCLLTPFAGCHLVLLRTISRHTPDQFGVAYCGGSIGAPRKRFLDPESNSRPDLRRHAENVRQAKPRRAGDNDSPSCTCATLPSYALTRRSFFFKCRIRLPAGHFDLDSHVSCGETLSIGSSTLL